MSNQLEFEICMDRVKVLNELITQTINKTEKFLRDEEVLIDFDSPRSTMFAELIGKKVYFKTFFDRMHCQIYCYNAEDQTTINFRVPVELVKFKEYE